MPQAPPQQNVSKHLTRLTEHGFITRERRGGEHRYRIIDQSPLEVLDLLTANLCGVLPGYLNPPWAEGLLKPDSIRTG